MMWGWHTDNGQQHVQVANHGQQFLVPLDGGGDRVHLGALPPQQQVVLNPAFQQDAAGGYIAVGLGGGDRYVDHTYA